MNLEWAKKISFDERSAYFLMIGFSIFGVIAAYLTHMEPGWIARISSLLTLLLGVASVARLYQFRWPLAGVAVQGAVFEIVGIYTQVPFGPYRYTTEWWPIVQLPFGQNFPLQLPLAWVLVVGACFKVVSGVKHPDHRIAATALLATLCDVIMEPVVVGKLRYWEWLGRSGLPYHISIQNFFGWFITSVIASQILTLGESKTKTLTDQRKPARQILGAYLLLMVVIFVFWRTS